MTFQRASALASVFLSSLVLLSAQQPAPSPPEHVSIPTQVRERLARDGRVRVIVELRLHSGRHVPEGDVTQGVAAAQRRAIGEAAARVIAAAGLPASNVIRRYRSVPFVTLDVGPAELQALESSPADVVRVMPDEIARPVLAGSVPLIQGDQAWQSGYDGAGTIIAIIDTGVDAYHPFLSGKVVEEACYSSTVAGISNTVCPNGLDEQVGAGAAAPCSLPDCKHGTHVAGIAAGNGATGGQFFSGVAKGAQLMAVQVASLVIDPDSCGGSAPCSGAFTSDIIAALEHVYHAAALRNIAAVNLSLGSGAFTEPCADSPYTPAIDNLRSIGIPSIAASGNSGARWSIASPACVPSAVSVGSVSKSDGMSWFADAASFLSLLAPGESINSSVPGAGFSVLSGTSMAAPHVSGGWAILHQAAPSATVTTLLDALRSTGRPITDNRPFGFVTVPRANVFEALATLVTTTNPAPTANALSPASVRAGIGPVVVAVSGSGFNAFSSGQWNGAARPTTVVSTTQLRLTLTASDIPEVGAGDISVLNPAPGGGTSATLSLAIDPPPVLAASGTLVGSGTTVTVTLTNGLGNAGDWLSFAKSGTPDSSYLHWTYVGTGVTSRTWSIVTPATSGTYEFRLIQGSGSRAATSAPVTVDASLNPTPVISALSPSSAFSNSGPFTLTVTGSGFTSASIVRWNGEDRATTFVSNAQLRAAVLAADVASTGTASVSVFSPPPGGGTTASLPFPVVKGPTLAVNATIVAPGTNVTVTLADGLGGSGDWLALASATAPNTAYLQWTYVGAGVTTRTWTVKMPSTAGTYEFRLFTAGSKRAATSPPVSVDTSLSPAPVITSVSPTTAYTASGPFTLIVNGTGFTTASVVRWNGSDRTTALISSSQLQAAITATDVSSPGTVQVSVFNPPPGGGTSASVAFPVVLGPTLSVDTTIVAAAANVTVTLKNGLGGSGDWLALAPVTAPNNSYLQWTYVGAGVTTRTWTVKMPTVSGPYEFRLFVAGSVRAATSAAVTVDAALNPAPAISSLSPSSAFAGSGPLTLTVTGTGFTSASVVRWNGSDRTTTFVSSTQLKAAITAPDIGATGTAQVSVFSPAPGGGNTSALPFTILVGPKLTVTDTLVAPGATVTVTLVDGTGGSGNWFALAASGTPNTSYLQWTYVGTGVTTRTWTVKMPATPGTYEFRYFLSGYTRAATSPTVTVGN